MDGFWALAYVGENQTRLVSRRSNVDKSFPLPAQAPCQCYDEHMSLPFDAKRFRAYEIEFGAGGDRLGCKFLLDDGSVLFVHESQITPEID